MVQKIINVDNQSSKNDKSRKEDRMMEKVIEIKHLNKSFGNHEVLTRYKFFSIIKEK